MRWFRRGAVTLVGVLLVGAALFTALIWFASHSENQAALERSAEVAVGDCLVLSSDRDLDDLNDSLRIEWSCTGPSHHGEVLALDDNDACTRAIKTVNKDVGRGVIQVGTVELLTGATACVAYVPDGWSMSGQILGGTLQVWAPGEPIRSNP
ncbi:MAG: hypothetical protein NTX33_18090 [Propionibacteriales bacterium]|nr:hypothetical protein [Propionibacteriales bacterium]